MSQNSAVSALSEIIHGWSFFFVFFLKNVWTMLCFLFNCINFHLENYIIFPTTDLETIDAGTIDAETIDVETIDVETIDAETIDVITECLYPFHTTTDNRVKTSADF